MPKPEPEPEPDQNQNASQNQFDHEKLDVYRAAIDFVTIASEIVEALPRGRAYLADQLHRAAASIALNIAEGAGEFSSKDKSRFYRMAKRSATECAAILHVCRQLGLIAPANYDAGRGLLLRVVAMLTKMVRNRDGSGSGSGSGSGT